ncbi:MAG: helix-turn-helix domain-containing protein [Desulfobacterales bacterium]|nr:helix-turn-helix domain-containing protein [Desulfobacterales bacterium]
MIKGAQSAYRILNILTLIVERGDEAVSPREISEELEIPLPTVHRLLAVLKECRFVVNDNASRGYKMGEECIVRPNLDLDQRIIARFSSVAHEAAETFGYTTSLYSRSGDDCTCVKRVEGTHNIQVFSSRLGERRPLGLGSCTLGILAALPEVEADGILMRNKEELKERLVGSWDAMTLFLADSRRRGYGYAYDLAVEGAAGLAFPLYSGDDVVGSITVDGLKGRQWDAALDEMVAFFRSRLNF